MSHTEGVAQLLNSHNDHARRGVTDISSPVGAKRQLVSACRCQHYSLHLRPRDVFVEWELQMILFNYNCLKTLWTLVNTFE